MKSIILIALVLGAAAAYQTSLGYQSEALPGTRAVENGIKKQLTMQRDNVQGPDVEFRTLDGIKKQLTMQRDNVPGPEVESRALDGIKKQLTMQRDNVPGPDVEFRTLGWIRSGGDGIKKQLTMQRDDAPLDLRGPDLEFRGLGLFDSKEVKKRRGNSLTLKLLTKMRTLLKLIANQMLFALKVFWNMLKDYFRSVFGFINGPPLSKGK